MNNTTYTANENCFLIDGEVIIIDRYSLVNIKTIPVKEPRTELTRFRVGERERWYYRDNDLAFVITHSTKPLDGIKPLPRDKFVKPVEQEAKEYALSQGENARNYAVAHDFICGRGKFEFTREEMIKGLNSVAIFASSTNNPFAIEAYINGFMDGLRPLTLPASIEINEQGEIVNVIW